MTLACRMCTNMANKENSSVENYESYWRCSSGRNHPLICGICNKNNCSAFDNKSTFMCKTCWYNLIPKHDRINKYYTAYENLKIYKNKKYYDDNDNYDTCGYDDISEDDDFWRRCGE